MDAVDFRQTGPLSGAPIARAARAKCRSFGGLRRALFSGIRPAFVNL